MAKAIRNVFKLDTISLYECNDGYYLYDYVVRMNISMRAKTEQDACIEALLWYQKKLASSKLDYKTLNDKVENFVSQFVDREDE
jgi:hypothetical protein